MTNNDFQFAKQEKRNISEIVGKPKNSFVEILRRFSSNKFYVVFLVVFILLIILAFIFSTITKYDPDLPVAVGVNNRFYANLPPSSNPVIKERIITVEFYKSIQELLDRQKAGAFSDLNFEFEIVEQKLAFGQYTVNYNAWHLLTAAVRQTNADENIPVLTSYLGTTSNGFDIWSRGWYSILYSLQISFLTATIQTVIGTAIGVYLGFHVGKWIDTIFLRLIEIFELLPQIVFFLLFISFFKTESGVSIFGLIFSIIVVGWSNPVWEARLFTLIVKDQEFVVAAEAIGASKMRRLVFHILPTIIGKLVNSYVLRIPRIIFLISVIAFLGFLPDQSNPNLGNVLQQATSDYSANIWNLLFPASLLLILTISLQFVAIGLHDALDPRLGRHK